MRLALAFIACFVSACIDTAFDCKYTHEVSGIFFCVESETDIYVGAVPEIIDVMVDELCVYYPEQCKMFPQHLHGLEINVVDGALAVECTELKHNGKVFDGVVCERDAGGLNLDGDMIVMLQHKDPCIGNGFFIHETLHTFEDLLTQEGVYPQVYDHSTPWLFEQYSDLTTYSKEETVEYRAYNRGVNICDSHATLGAF